jgi:DNA polymerase (family 10)
MSNPTTGKEVAEVLMEVSQGYAILGDKRRAMAFENAATGLMEWKKDEDVSSMSLAALQKIPMIGKSTAKSVQEITKTGTCGRLKSIRKKGLPSMADILSLPGVGPATARILWTDYGITTRKAMEEALENRSITTPTLRKKLIHGLANAPRTISIPQGDGQEEAVPQEMATRFASIMLPEQG